MNGKAELVMKVIGEGDGQTWDTATRLIQVWYLKLNYQFKFRLSEDYRAQPRTWQPFKSKTNYKKGAPSTAI